MKFFLFGGRAHYPCGGGHDFISVFDSLRDALAADRSDCDWWHIIDDFTRPPVVSCDKEDGVVWREDAVL